MMPTYSFVSQVLKLTERAQVLAEVKGRAVLLTATKRATRRANDTESPFCMLKLALRATVDCMGNSARSGARQEPCLREHLLQRFHGCDYEVTTHGMTRIECC